MPRPPASRLTQRRIAIVLHEDSFYVRSVLRGVASYARPAKPWVLERVPPEGVGHFADRSARFDGFITHIHHPSLAEAFASVTAPVVGVSNLIADDPFASVTADDPAVGRLACEHFLDHGHRHLAFLGLRRVAFSNDREAGFRDRATSAGIEVQARDIRPAWLQRSPRDTAPEKRRLVEWLKRLAHPTGLFACNDAVAWLISEVCREAEVEVPLRVAILGVDNDDLLCRLAYPPLSSVIVPGERIGYLAAEALDHAITRGRPIPDRRVPPQGIETRQSSEFYAVDDPDLADALAFIRDHATEGLTVEELLREVPVGRRSLERRFRERLGRTPLEEIHRVRVAAAREMLNRTTLPIQEVAQRCGFGRANYMSRLLVRLTGQTPRQVRQG
jgi:LacI family transcriptional regulator